LTVHDHRNPHLEHAVAWFARHGVSIERVMTDNGSAYRSEAFAKALAAHQIRHKRTRPYTPRTNGKAERFIKTLLNEWAYGRPYRSNEERLCALPRWLRFYNHERPHRAILLETPRPWHAPAPARSDRGRS
jgi:transposase InsO family protein